MSKREEVASQCIEIIEELECLVLLQEEFDWVRERILCEESSMIVFGAHDILNKLLVDTLYAIEVFKEEQRA